MKFCVGSRYLRVGDFESQGQILVGHVSVPSQCLKTLLLSRQQVSVFAPHLHPKQGYSKMTNGLVASMLSLYFDEGFLNRVGWTSRDGKIFYSISFICLSHFSISSTGRIDLKNKPGHLDFFFALIKKVSPGTFKTKGELRICLVTVLKRMRESEKRRPSSTSQGSSSSESPRI